MRPFHPSLNGWFWEFTRKVHSMCVFFFCVCVGGGSFCLSAYDNALITFLFPVSPLLKKYRRTPDKHFNVYRLTELGPNEKKVYKPRDLPLLGSHLLLLITFPASLYAAAAQGRTEMSNMSICT